MIAQFIHYIIRRQNVCAMINENPIAWTTNEIFSRDGIYIFVDACTKAQYGLYVLWHLRLEKHSEPSKLVKFHVLLYLLDHITTVGNSIWKRHFKGFQSNCHTALNTIMEGKTNTRIQTPSYSTTVAHIKIHKTWKITVATHHIDGLVQDCSNSSALAIELLQSCTKPSIYSS